MDIITKSDSAPVDWNILFNRFVARLRALEVGACAPKLYDRFEPFTLPDTKGRHVDLSDLLGRGPLVISFMRGGWCPYCRTELLAWADAIPRLEAVGGSFIAISAETGGRAETTRCELAPGAQMLCDIDHGLAMSLGLTFPIGAEVHARYTEYGIDLADIYGDSGQILPIPATFVIDAGGIVRYAFVDPDFRVRPDPAIVIAVVEACGPGELSLD